jgi:hypothetical protein
MIVPDPGVSRYEFTARWSPGAAAKPSAPSATTVPRPDRGDPVAFATGQFVRMKTDIVLPAPLPIVLERTFVAGELHPPVRHGCHP